MSSNQRRIAYKGTVYLEPLAFGNKPGSETETAPVQLFVNDQWDVAIIEANATASETKTHQQNLASLSCLLAQSIANSLDEIREWLTGDTLAADSDRPHTEKLRDHFVYIEKRPPSSPTGHDSYHVRVFFSWKKTDSGIKAQHETQRRRISACEISRLTGNDSPAHKCGGNGDILQRPKRASMRHRNA